MSKLFLNACKRFPLILFALTVTALLLVFSGRLSAQSSSVVDTAVLRQRVQYEDSVGAVLYNRGEFAEAQRYFREAASWRKQLLGRRSAAYLRSVNFVASALYNSGEVRQAIAMGDSLIQYITDSVSPNYVDLYDVYTNQMYCYYALRRLPKAIDFARKALAVIEAQEKSYPQSYVHALANLGYCLDAAHSNDEAKRYLDHAVAFAADSLQPLDNATLEAMHSQAYNYAYRGDYGRAVEIMHEVVRRTREAAPDSPNLAIRLAALSQFYASVNNYTDAIATAQEVQPLFEKYYGAESFNYNDLGQRIGNYYRETGDAARALDYHHRALAVAEKTYGTNHREYALALGNLAADYHHLDSLDKALELYRQAVAVLAQEDTEAALIMQFNISNILADQGHFAEARTQAEQIVSTFRDSIGVYHRDYPVALGRLAALYRQDADYDHLISTKREIITHISDRVNRIFPSLTERARAEYYAGMRHHLNMLVSVAEKNPTDETLNLLYDATLLNKGLLLASSIEFARYVEQTGDQNLIKNYRLLRRAQLSLQKYLQQPPKKHNSDTIRIRQAYISDLEQQVVTACHAYGSFMDRLRVQTADVRKALRKGEVAIEFVEEHGKTDNGDMVALILRKEWLAPKIVRLPNKSYLQPFVDLRARTYLNVALSDTIWQQIISIGQIRPTDKVYFAPDGPLYQLAIEYLPSSAALQGARVLPSDTVLPTMADVYQLYRLSSTRELCFRSAKTNRLEQQQLRNAVLYGGVYYNPTNARGTIQYLPGTLSEVQAIAEELGTTHLLTGLDASEETFKQMSGQMPELLHIATHGFCKAGVNESNAMQQTGMLLANSENAWIGADVEPTREDGILTAQEIAALNMSSNRLTVLSACETALGAITADGVAGLQRGFKKAGVHALIMTLWPVSDEATEKLMQAFYAYISQGLSPREALRNAQYDLRGFRPEPVNEDKTSDEDQARRLKFLRQQQARAAKQSKKYPFANPRYWAAFILLDGVE